MYTIGAFAQLGGVTVRMLRHYDGLGLFVPSSVDPATGHRYYEAAQLPRLNRLVALKDLGFTLEQVGQLLDEDIAPAELRGMLRLRAAELAQRLLHDQHALDRVRARLRLIESETMMPITDVEIKTIATQRVLSLHTTVSVGDDPGVEPLFERVIEHMEAVRADRSAPISWRETNEDVVHVYAGFIAPTGEVPGLKVVMLPEVHAASIVRRGAVHGMDEAHQALARWAEAQGYTASVERGRWRELYLETDDNDYSDWLIEVQLELTDNADRS